MAKYKVRHAWCSIHHEGEKDTKRKGIELDAENSETDDIEKLRKELEKIIRARYYIIKGEVKVYLEYDEIK